MDLNLFSSLAVSDENTVDTSPAPENEGNDESTSDPDAIEFLGEEIIELSGETSSEDGYEYEHNNVADTPFKKKLNFFVQMFQKMKGLFRRQNTTFEQIEASFLLEDRNCHPIWDDVSDASD